jgi:surface polysaccharide O-acyltransferase-like enzyme
MLSRCTFGIYLSQMIVLRQIVWPLTPWLGRIHWVVDSLVSGVITFIVCFLLVFILRRLPLRRYIVGK